MCLRILILLPDRFWKPAITNFYLGYTHAGAAAGTTTNATLIPPVREGRISTRLTTTFFGPIAIITEHTFDSPADKLKISTSPFPAHSRE